MTYKTLPFAQQSKKMILPMIIIMLFMAVLPLVNSATEVSIQFETGYEITPSLQSFHEQNNDILVDFFINNKTNGIPITNSTTQCIYYLADNQGKVLINSNVLYLSTGYWSINIKGENFTRLGEYNYGIKCNSTTQGGTYVGQYQISKNGEEATEGKAIFYVGILAVLLFFLGLGIFGFISFDHLLARVGLFGISYLLLMSITFIGWNMANDFLTSSPFLISALRIAFFVLIAGFFPLVIGAFAYYVIMIFKIKEIERLMGKGFSRDEAEHRQGRKFK